MDEGNIASSVAVQSYFTACLSTSFKMGANQLIRCGVDCFWCVQLSIKKSVNQCKILKAYQSSVYQIRLKDTFNIDLMQGEEPPKLKKRPPKQSLSRTQNPIYSGDSLPF
jgi:hypothetical protein